MTRYRLIDQEGADVGPFVSPRGEWQPGDLISRTPGERFVVVNVVPADEHETFRAYLVVRRT